MTRHYDPPLRPVSTTLRAAYARMIRDEMARKGLNAWESIAYRTFYESPDTAKAENELVEAAAGGENVEPEAARLRHEYLTVAERDARLAAESAREFLAQAPPPIRPEALDAVLEMADDLSLATNENIASAAEALAWELDARKRGNP